MERIHMNHLRDLIHRLRIGESERRIGLDMKISRQSVHKYHELAKQFGFLEKNTSLPDNETLQKALGPSPQPPRKVSSLEAYGEIVKTMRKQEVEMVAIWQRLRDNYGYSGSYSSVRRYVSHFEIEPKEAYTRVHTLPGEELQVDFGTLGQII